MERFIASALLDSYLDFQAPVFMNIVIDTKINMVVFAISHWSMIYTLTCPGNRYSFIFLSP